MALDTMNLFHREDCAMNFFRERLDALAVYSYTTRKKEKGFCVCYSQEDIKQVKTWTDAKKIKGL